ncbi:MAG: GNAT family N-acetyltransferase, partial [Pseudomonadales bacterium]
MDEGFDQLSHEEGVEIESSERISFVAENGSELAGCASGLAFKNGNEYSGWFQITDLYVAKELRSQGIGQELLRALEAHIHTMDLERIFLWTSG